MDDLQAQTTNELRRLIPLVEELTGLTSRWNGTLELVPDALFKGKKPCLSKNARLICLLLLNRFKALCAGSLYSPFLPPTLLCERDAHKEI